MEILAAIVVIFFCGCWAISFSIECWSLAKKGEWLVLILLAAMIVFMIAYSGGPSDDDPIDYPWG